MALSIRSCDRSKIQGDLQKIAKKLLFKIQKKNKVLHAYHTDPFLKKSIGHEKGLNPVLWVMYVFIRTECPNLMDP